MRQDGLSYERNHNHSIYPDYMYFIDPAGFQKKNWRRFQYALWLLVALRLVIPVSIPVSLPMAEFMDPYHLMGFDTDDVVEQLEQPIQVTIHSGNIYHLLAEDSDQTADNASGETGEHVRFLWPVILVIAGWMYWAFYGPGVCLLLWHGFCLPTGYFTTG